MASLADQNIAELGGALSILTRQKREHERLDELRRGERPATRRT
jgi:hypothetical protein